MTASGRKFAAFPTSRVATAGVVHPAGRHNYAPSHLPCASPITTSWVRGALTHNRLDMPLSVSITNSAAVRRSLPNARVGLWLTSARPWQRHVGIKHSNVGGLASALAVAGAAAGKHRRKAASQARERGALRGWPYDPPALAAAASLYVQAPPRRAYAGWQARWRWRGRRLASTLLRAISWRMRPRGDATA